MQPGTHLRTVKSGIVPIFKLCSFFAEYHHISMAAVQYMPYPQKGCCMHAQKHGECTKGLLTVLLLEMVGWHFVAILIKKRVVLKDAKAQIDIDK